MKKPALLGLISGVLSICLWIVFSFFNPYSNTTDIELVLNPFILLCLPACLAITSFVMSQRVLMLIALYGHYQPVCMQPGLPAYLLYLV